MLNLDRANLSSMEAGIEREVVKNLILRMSASKCQIALDYFLTTGLCPRNVAMLIVKC